METLWFPQTKGRSLSDEISRAFTLVADGPFPSRGTELIQAYREYLMIRLYETTDENQRPMYMDMIRQQLHSADIKGLVSHMVHERMRTIPSQVAITAP